MPSKTRILAALWIAALAGSARGASLPAISFEAPETYPMTSDTFQVLAGDFNGDGLPDIVVCEQSGVVSILLNQGQTEFQPAGSYQVGASAAAMVIGDFNNDGKLDVAIAVGGAAPGIAVLLGNGDGTFALGSLTSVPGASFGSLTVADFNRDGKADLAATDPNSNQVSVLFGNGDGTFGNLASFAVGSQPTTAATADFNGDGNPDLVVANSNGSNLTVLLGDGRGGFQPPNSFAAGKTPVSIAIADFNGDGKPDLAVANSGDPFSPETETSLSILLGNGDGTFQPQIVYTNAGPIPTQVAAIDFYHDGKADLVVTSFTPGQYPPNFINIFTSNGDGTFQAGTYPVTGFIRAFAVADFAGSGAPGLAFLTDPVHPPPPVHFWSYLGILTADGRGGFERAPSYRAGKGPWSVAAGDVNGDGIPDLAVAHPHSHRVTLLFGNGKAGFGKPVSLPAGDKPWCTMLADVNGDGKLDLIVGNKQPFDQSSGALAVFLGNGDGTFQPMIEQQIPGGVTSLAIGDFNGDGKPDLVIGSDRSKFISVVLGNGNGTFQAPVTYFAGGGLGVAVADFNGDGKLDIAVATGGSASVLLGKGDGTFGRVVEYLTAGADGIAAGDFNGDGIPDLAVAGSGFPGSALSILLGTGDGTFWPPVVYPLILGNNVSSLVVGDFDGDGLLDLAISGYEQVTILRGTSKGTLAQGPSYFVGAITGLAAADFNGDGKLDLAASGRGVTVLVNNTP